MTDYRNPQKGQWKPHAEYSPDSSLWIRLDAWTLTAQAAWGRGNIVTEYAGDSFTFLAPKEFIESTSHEWADYESIMGRLAHKAAELEKGATEVGQGLSSGTELLKELVTMDHKSIKTALEKSAGGMTVINQRYDAPLYYKGSERRKFDLIFYLVEEGNPANDVVAPVRALQSLSSPAKDGMLYGIVPPRIFSIATEPDSDFIYIEYAALKSVQPTWRGPYIGGFPSSCELLLSFEDMTPLFEDSFGKNYVNVRAINVPGVPASAQAASNKVISTAKKAGQKYTGPIGPLNAELQEMSDNIGGPSGRK